MKFIGIDLGTTYSAMVEMDELSPSPFVVANAAGEMTTPSVVYITEDGENVGTMAKKRLKTKPDQTVEMAKRFMGTDRVWNILGKDYTPVDISAMILKYLVDGTSVTGGEDYVCTITCPASYDQNTRVLVKEAAKLAGIKEPLIVNEPTAAALAYCFQEDRSKGNSLVFDLGGGTLDVTAIHYDKDTNKYEVLASDGKDKLGGRDWDNVVKGMVTEAAAKTLGCDKSELDNDVEVQAALDSISEDIKKELSMDDYVGNEYIRQQPVEIDITVEEFERRTRPMLDTALSLIQSVLDIVKLNKDQHPDLETLEMDNIILVGGSSRMPQIKKGIEDAYPQFAGRTWIFEPAYAIAKGAAYYGKLVGSAKKDCGYAGKKADFTEVLPMTFGVQVFDKDVDCLRCHNMLFKNDQIPFSFRQKFELSDGQTIINSKVLMNHARDKQNQVMMELDECQTLSEMHTDLPFKAKDREPIFVTYSINLDGTLEVTVECRDFLQKFEVDSKSANSNLKRADY